MKYLILSDIHGSVSALKRVLDYYDNHRFDLLILLGDILNYGPRNGVPADLDAPGIVNLLSPRAKDIIAVRGNCDSEVDQMLLPFPMMGDYTLICDHGHRLFLTHGHRYNEDNLPPAPSCELFVYGHTHLPVIKPAAEGKPAICNTGSPTFPKGGNPPTFATLEEGLLSIRTLDGGTLSSLKLY